MTWLSAAVFPRIDTKHVEVKEFINLIWRYVAYCLGSVL